MNIFKKFFSGPLNSAVFQKQQPPGRTRIPAALLPALLFITLWWLCLAAGCKVATGPVYKSDDGKLYGTTRGLFRGQWWNYYERGNSYAEGGYWDDALRDYKEALKGRDRDQRRARTYGVLNFIDYFAHRELGVAFYHLARYEEAVGQLDRSLRDTESAKAKLYLNRSRKAILQRDGTDSKAPVIRLDSPQPGEWVRDYEIDVRGEVRDDGFVAALRINDQPLPIELAQPLFPFSRKVFIGRGDRQIQVESRDLVGRITVATVTLRVDREGPQVAVEEIRCRDPLSCTEVIVAGYVDDVSEISWVSIGGQRLPNSGLSAFAFNQAVLLERATRSIDFTAEDILGNRTQGKIRIPPADSFETSPSQPLTGLPQVAMVGSLNRALDVAPYLLAPPHSQKIRLASTAQTRVARAGIAWPAFTRDKPTQADFPPEITLKDLTGEQRVYFDTLYIEGNVVASSPVHSLLINGHPILRRSSLQLFFSHFLHLEPGENQVTIRAEDSRGHTTEKTILINYHMPKIHQLRCRLRVSLLPIALLGEQPYLGEYIYDALMNAFVNQKRFRIVDRADLAKILFELELGQKDLTDPDTAARVGKLAAAEAVITGSAYEGEHSIEIFAQMIDPETSEVILSKDVYYDNKDLKTIRKLSEGLAHKFKQAMPVVEGSVVDLKGKKVFTDLGREELLLRGMRFVVFREGAPKVHPETGKPLGCETLELAEAVVKGVYEEMSVGEIIKGTEQKTVKTSDQVITK